jgi:hypothetical protein
MAHSNLFVALRDNFPDDRDEIAIETCDGPALYYTWRDIDRASARIANLLDWLGLPPGHASRCRPRSRSRRFCCTWRCCARAMCTCR